MTKYSIFFLTLVLISQSACSQVNMKAYEGGWSANIDNARAFSIDMTLEWINANELQVLMSNGQHKAHNIFSTKKGHTVNFRFNEHTSFEGTLSEDQSEIKGFMKSGTLFYHLVFKKNTSNQYIGRWNFFMVNALTPTTFFLNVEGADGDEYQAYPFFADQRFRGTWAINFEKEGNNINFYDFRGGLLFEGQLMEGQIHLSIFVGSFKIATLILNPTEGEWERGNSNSNRSTVYEKPTAVDDGWSTAALDLEKCDYSYLKNMTDSIYDNTLTYVHSVLISKENKLVFEKYFSDHNMDVAHDQRSSAKSIYSAIVGMAIEDGIIKKVDQSIYDFLPEAYQYTKTPEKAAIKIKDCLTMSSGLDAIDFGINRNSVASEDNYQNSADWAKTVLEAPMIDKPGAHANYSSANPYLLGLALGNAMEESLESYIDRKLMAPLGITNYFINTDEKGQVYFGGGMHITPRDMLKFGQLYLDDGTWKGQQVLSKDWVDASFKNYLVLENTDEKNGYGYLWWHQAYEVNGKTYHSVDARGAGGQYIAVFKELDMVVVITGGNYRNGRYWQPELMIREYILPAILAKK